jgi:RNA polymerase sigma factor (sigma-70 family)
MEDRLLVEAVARLPRKLRDAVALRYYHGLSAEETAKALGVRINVVYDRIQKARGLLRVELEEAD